MPPLLIPECTKKPKSNRVKYLQKTFAKMNESFSRILELAKKHDCPIHARTKQGHE